jgi:hypothetical protein
LGIKPQLLGSLAPDIASLLAPGALVISILAGTTTHTLSGAFPSARIVRLMPNLAAAIGKSPLGVFAPNATELVKTDIAAWLTPLGAVIWIDDEAHMDAVTALAGSGPAFIYRVIDALTKGGETAGLPHAVAAHDEGEAARHVPPSYTPLLAASRVLHPMGYLVIGALAPILPYLFGSLGTDPALQAPLGAIWHVARLAAVLVLWQTAFWHGRGESLAVAGAFLAGGFALAVAARGEGTLALGLIGIGLGQGVIYYSAIYYGLAVGGAKVEAGGTHEALVGAGYFLGPLLGIATFSLGFGPSAFIGVVLGALAVGFVASVLRAGRARSQRTA